MAFLYLRGSPNAAPINLGQQTLLGSDAQSDLCLHGPGVQVQHCLIVQLPDGRFRINQISDAAKIFINGHQVTQSILGDGDELKIGDHIFCLSQSKDEFIQDRDIDFDDVSAKISLRQQVNTEGLEKNLNTNNDRDLKKLRAAYALTRSIGLGHKLDDTLATVLDAAIQVFSPERAAIFLLKPGTHEIIAQHFRSALPETTRMRVSRSVLRKAISNREAIVSIDALSDERFSDAHSVRLSNVHSVVALPMLYDDSCLGVLYLDSSMRSGLFDSQDLELLTAFAKQSALVVNNANLINTLQKTNHELQIATESALAANASLLRKTEELEKLVIRDPLTGLFNHAYLQDQVGQEIARSQRQGQQFSLILINIDAFRAVNDSLGHEAGNRLLRKLSDILQKATRRVDLGAHIGGETITRYGGDIFAILLPGTDKRGATVAAERLRQIIGGSNFADDNLPKPSVSLGVAAFPSDASKRSDLVTAAETALFAAKQVGGGQCIAYSSALRALSEKPDDSELGRILALDRVIQQALLVYLYQPIVEAKTRNIFAYEALCRPQDAAFRGPEELINTAERKGRITELGVLMRQIAIKALPQLAKPKHLFVNLHPMELNDALLPWAEACTHRERIVLEITESAAVQEHDRVRALITQLKSMGFRIAVDDLGSGYSGLNSLALLEPEFVKLDMRMVRNIENNPRAARLITHILDFAKGEGMVVIAEGVETELENRVVTDLGCDLIQGYFYSRPQPPFCELVKARG